MANFTIKPDVAKKNSIPNGKQHSLKNGTSAPPAKMASKINGQSSGANGDTASSGKTKPKQNFKALLPDTPGEMLCFDRSEFVRLDFCVDEFVAECRKRVHLEQLRQDLEKYFKRLKGAMIDLINKDYHEFVSLSAHLADLDKQLIALRRPLNDITTDTTESRTTLDTELASLMKLLKNRHEEATRSRLIQNAIAVLNKLEAAETSFAKFREDSENIKMLEKSIDAYNITRHHADLTSQFPTTKQAQDRIKMLEAELISTTERELLNTLSQARANKQSKISQQGTSATVDLDLVQKIQLLLTSAMLLNSIQRIEKSIQDRLVAPAVRRLIDDYKATGKHISLKAAELSKFFKSLLTLLEDPCGILIEISSGRHGAVGGIPGYDFAVRAIWPEIVDQVQSNIPHLFMVTNLQDFHKRYGIARSFLVDFERRCGSQASVKRLRNSAKYISWGSSWPLMSYFNKIQKLQSEHFEEQLRLSNTSATVIQVCKDLFQEDLFLEKLTARFWRLCAMFLKHYVATSTSKLSPDQSANETASAAATSVPDLVQRFIDLSRLENALPELAQSISKKLPPSQSDHGAEFSAKLFASVGKQILDTRGTIVTLLMSGLADISLSQLCKAKDVPRLYRRTNRDLPKETSAYVDASFSSLEEIGKQNELPEELKLRLATHCAKSCAPKFEQLVEDVLSNVKKMEESLIKLQKIRKKPQQSQQKSGVTDDYKIRLQLKLDLETVVTKYTHDYGVESTQELIRLEEIASSIGTMLNDSSRNLES